jgi:hypothetical protein
MGTGGYIPVGKAEMVYKWLLTSSTEIKMVELDLHSPIYIWYSP